MTLVSVIIPTWNRASLVVEAVQSVLLQTHTNVQIIVVDDGSTDNTAAAIANFSDVLYLYQSHQGQGAARNLGLRYAQGDYIATLDADDLWSPEFLECCLKALLSLELDFVFANWTALKLNGTCEPSCWNKLDKWQSYATTSLPNWRLISPDQSRQLFLECCPSPSSALLFRRRAIANGWDERMRTADDRCLLIEAVLSYPCWVGFTMQRLWIKRCVGDNIYDGRHALVQIQDSGIHDTQLIMQRFEDRLTRLEKKMFLRRLVIYELLLSFVYWRKHYMQLQTLNFVLRTLIKNPDFVLDLGLRLAVKSYKIIRSRLSKTENSNATFI